MSVTFLSLLHTYTITHTLSINLSAPCLSYICAFIYTYLKNVCSDIHIWKFFFKGVKIDFLFIII